MWFRSNWPYFWSSKKIITKDLESSNLNILEIPMSWTSYLSSLNLWGPNGPLIPTVLSYNAFKLPFSNCMYYVFYEVLLRIFWLFSKNPLLKTTEEYKDHFGPCTVLGMHALYMDNYVWFIVTWTPWPEHPILVQINKNKN